MPWEDKRQASNQPDDPWGRSQGNGGPPDPWGKGKRRPANQDNEIDRIVELGRESLRRFNGGGGRGRSGGGSGGSASSGGFSPRLLITVVIVALLGLWLTQAIRINAPGEVGLVLTLGRFYERDAQGEIASQGRIDARGTHLILWPFQTYRRVNVDVQNESTIGFRRSTGRNGEIRLVSDESDMLTSDRNIITIALAVQWRIDPERADQYIFNARDPEAVLADAAESVIRGLMATTLFEEALDERRGELQELAQTQIDELVNGRYGLGIRLDNVLIEQAEPQADTQVAFQRVSASEAEQGRLQQEAILQRNTALFNARAEAERVVRTAQGFRASAVLQAIGEAERFLAIYNAYVKQPQAFTERQVLDAIEDVLGSGENIILENNGVLPYLPLPAPAMQPSGLPSGAANRNATSNGNANASGSASGAARSVNQ